MRQDILDRFTGKVKFSAEIKCEDDVPLSWRLRLAVLTAIKSGANMRGADLRGANMSSANLHGVNMRGANMSGANMSGANMSGANMRGADMSFANMSDADMSSANMSDADMRGANMHGVDMGFADLSGADMSGANMHGVNLRDANLHGVNMRGANMSSANLYGADMYGANLYGANLYGANLYGAKNSELTTACTVILPDGDLVVWKKLANGHLAKLIIPEDAQRLNASGRKCRASYAKVLNIYDAKTGKERNGGVSSFDSSFVYRVGEIVRPKEKFDTNRWNECASGIHFYITRVEAENN